MGDVRSFGLVLLVVGGAGLLAVLSNRLTERVRVPAPALFLIGAAIAAELVPGVRALSHRLVERVVTAALVVILFDGGMHIGWSRFRRAVGPIVLTGVLGTFLTVGAVAAFVHVAFGLGWYVAALVATAVAPTDPAVVFSILGPREVPGPGGLILEGESGANDPVGIALMAGLIAAGGLSGSSLLQSGGELAQQMAVGLAVGWAGGLALVWFTRRVSLPGEGLYPVRTLAGVLLIYGVTSVAGGSGFLAVFVAGIVGGDQPGPFKAEIRRFHTALASLGEIVAFVALGLTVDVGEIAHADVWVPGILIGLMLALVIRPVVIGLCLLPARLPTPERIFVLFAGLKGAVPILLASFFFTAQVPGANRLYGLVVVTVVFSVVGQGSLVPLVARGLRLALRPIEPTPWALSVRLRDEPEEVHRFTVAAGSPAEGRRIDELADRLGDAWVSLIVRDGQLVRARGRTRLQAGDDVVLLADSARHHDLRSVLERPTA